MFYDSTYTGYHNVAYDETGENGFQAVRDEAQKLIVNGLEIKLLSMLQDLLTCSYPENMVSSY